MANRGLWKFPYPADKLLDAATAKKTWHEERLAWWAKKRDEMREKIKAEGIEIYESVALGLVVDLTECVNKVSEHQGKIKDYDAWTQVLASQGQASFDLYQDDWLFFFGK